MPVSSVSAETISIPLPGVTVQRPSRRGEPWRLTLGRFLARGTTLAAAKADLARQIGVTVDSTHVEPAFARDDDGTSLIVALDRPWGVDEYRITEGGHKLIGTYDRDPDGPAEVLRGTHHYTPIPRRR